MSTELIDATDDKTVWADSYDRDLTGIFAIKSEVLPNWTAEGLRDRPRLDPCLDSFCPEC